MQYFCILFKAALEDAAAANGLPLEEKSLSEILGTDEDGSPKMYTTLYVDQNRIISTNDPTLAQDSFYLGGGTLDLGAAAFTAARKRAASVQRCPDGFLAVRKKKSNKQPIIPPRSERGRQKGAGTHEIAYRLLFTCFCCITRRFGRAALHQAPNTCLATSALALASFT